MICKYCGKECKNKNSLVQHEIRCKQNPNRIEYSGYAAKKFNQIGHKGHNQYTKAKELGLEVHNKPDSQEICFVKDNDYANYVKRHANQDIKEGNFVDTKGNILGRHKGIVFYTIGQRKGLGIAFGKPMFVLDINPETNEVILGSNDDLFSNELIAKDVNLITVDEITEPIRVEAKIRYSARPAAATVYNNGKDSIRIVFDEPQRAITKGQSVVMYQGDKVVGGGIIDKSL